MKNNGWISVKDRLPESGQEVLIYYYDEGYEIDAICILSYFSKGAVMDTIIPTKYTMWEKNLLDALFNPENKIKAPEDGFYIYDCSDGEDCSYRRHADVITHWRPLPEPPNEYCRSEILSYQRKE